MLACLVDECRSEQFGRIEVAHGEAVEPRFASAAVAMQPRPAAVPLTEINAVRPALAEMNHGHAIEVYGKAKKKQS